MERIAIQQDINPGLAFTDCTGNEMVTDDDEEDEATSVNPSNDYDQLVYQDEDEGSYDNDDEFSVDENDDDSATTPDPQSDGVEYDSFDYDPADYDPSVDPPSDESDDMDPDYHPDDEGPVDEEDDMLEWDAWSSTDKEHIADGLDLHEQHDAGTAAQAKELASDVQSPQQSTGVPTITNQGSETQVETVQEDPEPNTGVDHGQNTGVEQEQVTLEEEMDRAYGPRSG